MDKSEQGIRRDGGTDPMHATDEAADSLISSGSVDLRERGIDETQAADLRHRLSSFAEDWDRPEMTQYDEPLRI